MSERAQALEAALRALRNECHAIKSMSYDEIKASAGYTNLKCWMDRMDEVDALLAVPPPPPVGSPTTERDQLREALAAIQQSTRDDEKGEQWTIRNFLNKHGVFNDDISGSRRLVAEACRYVLSTPVEPAGASEPPHVVKLWASGGWHATACHDYLMSDGSIRTMKHEEAMALKPAPVSPVEPTPSINCPLCGEAVQQVSSATLSLALSQHVLWACRRAPNKVEPTPEPPAETRSELREVREQLAALAHEQWAGWMAHVFRKCEQRVGGWWMPAEWADRWLRQIATPYLFLTPSEQDSYRKEAERVLGVMLTVAPTGAPAPCVWRPKKRMAQAGCPESRHVNADGAVLPLIDVLTFHVCPYCKAPLTVER